MCLQHASRAAAAVGSIRRFFLARSLAAASFLHADPTSLSPSGARFVPLKETGGRGPLSDAGSVSAMPTVLASALHDDDRRQPSSAPVVRGYCGVDRRDRRLVSAGVSVFGAAVQQRQRAMGRSGGQVRRPQEHDGLRAQPAVQLRRPHVRIRL